MKTSGLALLLLITLVLSRALPAFATTVIAPEFDQLVAQADYVVRAKVTAVTSEWREEKGQRHIFTYVALEVTEVIAGTPPQPLVLELLGGRVGDDEMRIDGTPQFAVGDQDILFVHGNGRQAFPLVALMHGRYPVKQDAMSGREYMARSNGAALYDTQEVAQPMRAPGAARAATAPAEPLSPAAFAAKIRGAFSASHAQQSKN